jgi:hypothetical protein
VSVRIGQIMHFSLRSSLNNYRVRDKYPKMCVSKAMSNTESCVGCLNGRRMIMRYASSASSFCRFHGSTISCCPSERVPVGGFSNKRFEGICHAMHRIGLRFHLSIPSGSNQSSAGDSPVAKTYAAQIATGFTTTNHHHSKYFCYYYNRQAPDRNNRTISNASMGR